MDSWQIQEAKSRISELIKRAQERPQNITSHGKSVAVVLSRAQFDRLSLSEGSLVDFMQRSPLAQIDDIDLERDKSLTRETAF